MFGSNFNITFDSYLPQADNSSGFFYWNFLGRPLLRGPSGGMISLSRSGPGLFFGLPLGIGSFIANSSTNRLA